MKSFRVWVALLGLPLLLSCGGEPMETVPATKNPCFYDPNSDGYRECLLVDAFGDCMTFSAIACSPKDENGDPCMYDFDSETYRNCYHVTADGKCAHYGGPCTPVD